MNGKIKDTKNKPVLSFIPYRSLKAISKIREYGNTKYKGDGGWQLAKSIDFVDAALRHLHKHTDAVRYDIGSIYDDESKLQHLHHAACSLILAIEVEENERTDKAS